MQENSFLPSEEPQEQHQGEGAKGILWRNLLSSISQLFIVRSFWNLVGISHSRLSTSFVKETYLSNHQGIPENNNIGDLYERKFIPTIKRTSGTTSRRRCSRNIVTKSSFFNFSAVYCLIIVKFGGHLPFSIIYNFCKWYFSLQPPGDPREQHPGDARQRTSSS